MNEILKSFGLSIYRFEEVLKQEESVIARDAAIQRFEFTIELAWKAIQKFLRGEEIVARSPKQCFKEAFSFGLIEDDQVWIEMLEDRNTTVHTYDEATAKTIYQRLPKYLPYFKQLCNALENEIRS